MRRPATRGRLTNKANHQSKAGYSILTNGVNDTLIAPILERLAVLSTIMERNDAEHYAIVDSIAENRKDRELQINNLMEVFRRSRIWSIVIMLVGMVGIGMLTLIFSVLSRSPLP